MPWDESTNPEVGKRILRGARMIEGGKTPIKIAEDRFEIPSQTNGNVYTVSRYANKWVCNCPDFEFRHVTCKHIHAVTLWLRLSEKLNNERPKDREISREVASEDIGCKFCGSSQVIKYGKANNKQVYKCKSCATTAACRP